jgi:putative peptidoglycan lipid II flippase
MSVLIFVTLPLGLILAALHVPIIQVLFQRGHFDAGATAVTSRIFAISVLGLTPMAIAVALTTVFKSLQDTKTVAFVGGGSNLGSKIVLNALFIGPFGVFGLALSSALQNVLSGILLFRRLSRRLNGIGFRHLAVTFGKTLLASLVAFLAVHVVTLSTLPPLVQCILGVLAGTTTFLLLVALLRMEELGSIAQYLVGEGSIGQRLTIGLHKYWPALPVIGRRKDDADY